MGDWTGQRNCWENCLIYSLNFIHIFWEGNQNYKLLRLLVPPLFFQQLPVKKW
jgi:hypothetical protein